jgi:hypothetical protein
MDRSWRRASLPRSQPTNDDSQIIDRNGIDHTMHDRVRVASGPSGDLVEAAVEVTGVLAAEPGGEQTIMPLSVCSVTRGAMLGEKRGARG